MLLEVPFASPSASLNSFNARHGFDFKDNETTNDLDYYLRFCEYVYSFVKALMQVDGLPDKFLNHVADHIETELNIIGYAPVGLENGLFIFVEEKPEVIEAARVAPLSIGAQIMRYGHQSMVGDIETKRQVLLLLADMLEPRREDLKSIDSNLSNDLFFAFNNMHVRHNNIEPGTSYYKEPIAKLSSGDMELWYDRVYTMSLEAILALQRYGFADEIKGMKEKLSTRG